MKKSLSVILVLVLILTCFAGCKKLKGAKMFTYANGDEVPLATDKDGSVLRDADGNPIEMVTDENGLNVTDADGNYVTKLADLEKALVIDGAVELRNYAVKIPDGWSNQDSLYYACIKKDDSSDDQIMFNLITDGDIVESEKNAEEMTTATKDKFPDAVTGSEGVKVGDETYPLYYAYIPEGDDGTPQFLGYMFLENEDGLYRFILTSERNLAENMDEISEILEGVWYK